MNMQIWGEKNRWLHSAWHNMGEVVLPQFKTFRTRGRGSKISKNSVTICGRTLMTMEVNNKE